MDHYSVIVLTSSYPRFTGDSASVFLKYLCVSLASKGLTVHVVAPASDSNDSDLGDGVHIHRFRYLPRRFRKLCYGSGILPNLKQNPLLWASLPFFLISMFLTLVLVARSTKARIIHSHWVIPQGFVALMSRPFHSAKIVVSVHGSDAFSLGSVFARFLKRLTLSRSDAWTANTYQTAIAASGSRYTEKLSVIPMGLSIDTFQSGDRDKFRTFSANKTVLLFVGRLVEKKGLPDLLKAFSLLPSEIMEDCMLWIVGDGQLRTTLESDSAQLGIGELVKFWGAQPNDELPDFYAGADIFVGPSESEGQGIVFLEAFAAGVPVIATNVGGIPEIVKDETTGLLVPPNDPATLSNVITRLATDPVLQQKLSNNAGIDLSEKYSWDAVSEKFLSLYSRQLDHNPSKR